MVYRVAWFIELHGLSSCMVYRVPVVSYSSPIVFQSCRAMTKAGSPLREGEGQYGDGFL
jgi:hypothetical protein